MLMPFIVPRSTPPSVNLSDQGTDTTNSTTHTFSSRTLLNPEGSRVIVLLVEVTAASTPTISSVTAAGQTADEVVTQFSSGLRASIYAVALPTGSSGDVVVTTSASTDRCSIGVYDMHGCSKTASATANNTSDPMTTTITIGTDNSVVIGGANNYAQARGTTWSAGLTEDYDQTVEATDGQSGASDVLATETNRTVTATLDGATDGNVLLVACFPPG